MLNTKYLIPFLICLFGTFSYAQKTNFKVLYKEIHPSSYLASSFESEKSLLDFVRTFEETENLVINEYIKLPLNDNTDSCIFLFSLAELDDFQQAKFIYYRTENLSKAEQLGAIQTLNSRKKIKVKTIIKSLSK